MSLADIKKDVLTAIDKLGRRGDADSLSCLAGNDAPLRDLILRLRDLVPNDLLKDVPRVAFGQIEEQVRKGFIEHLDLTSVEKIYKFTILDKKRESQENTEGSHAAKLWLAHFLGTDPTPLQLLRARSVGALPRRFSEDGIEGAAR